MRPSFTGSKAPRFNNRGLCRLFSCGLFSVILLDRGIGMKLASYSVQFSTLNTAVSLAKSARVRKMTFA
jgi:hypothetical protein